MFLLNIIIGTFYFGIFVKSEDVSCPEIAESFTVHSSSKSISLVEIDINEYTNAEIQRQKEIAHVLDVQLHEIGTFRIKNHGLPLALTHKLYDETRAFFEQTTEYKSNYATNGVLGTNGWEPIGSKTIGSAYNLTKKDPVESLQFWFIQLFNDKPAELAKYCPPDLAKTIISYCKETRRIANVLQNIFTLALDLNANQFEIDTTEVNDTSITDHYFNQFALWNFPDFADVPDGDIEFSEEYRMGTHQDWSGITIVSSDDVEGAELLQVQLERVDNEWYTVSNKNIADDSLVINIGEAMAMYTSGYWLSPVHRVSAYKKKRRTSIVYFVGPNMNRIIDELKDCQKCKENRNDTVLQRYQLPMAFKKHARRRFGDGFVHNDELSFWS